jgi:peptide subunit release factor 1 (eRF1)
MAERSHVVTDLRGLQESRMESPVLSLYLPMTETPAVDRGYVALAKDLLATVAEMDRLASEQKRLLLDHIQGMTPAGKTAVFFQPGEAKQPVTLTLQLQLPGLAQQGAEPYLVPLLALEENYPLIAVVAVDEREARLILVDLGETVGVTRLRDDVPGRQRQGGWAAFRYERDRTEHVRAHLSHVASELEGQMRTLPVKRVVLAGSPETCSGLLEALPAATRSVVAGQVPLEMFASDSEIVSRCLGVAEDAERQEEMELADQVMELALAGGRASLGWDETLQVLAEGRVHKLALADTEIGSDRADSALKLAWSTGATVEFMRGSAAERLADNGGIGAVLRY